MAISDAMVDPLTREAAYWLLDEECLEDPKDEQLEDHGPENWGMDHECHWMNYSCELQICDLVMEWEWEIALALCVENGGDPIYLRSEGSRSLPSDRRLLSSQS